MVALIIAIIAIGLIVAVVASTMYHGAGTDKGASEAKAAELLAQSQQIVAGDTFYRADNGGASPASLEALVPAYLKSIPKGWGSVDGFVVSSADIKISDDACKAYNAKQQVVGIPECSDASYADKQLCCHVDGD